jgi:dihydroneopterin aldolase
MDTLFLEGFEIPCRVGCTEAERALPQSLRVDVRMFCPGLHRAGETDDLAHTVDYRIAADMTAALQKSEFLLIERVAEELAQVALQNPHVVEVEITVRKRPPVQGIEMVGVQIRRSRR